MKNIEQALKEAKQYIEQTVPEIIGTEAQNHFRQSFHNEGFTDQTLEPWDEVWRRKPDSDWQKKSPLGGRGYKKNPTKGAKRTRAILTGDTGELGDSLTYTINGNTVEITSDKEYAEAQNEGTETAGRSRNVKIPKRQFAGESQQLEKAIVEIIENDLKNIFQ